MTQEMLIKLCIDWTIKFAMSFACGAILGLERKFRQQVVGMRTLILICESCTLLSTLSVEMAALGIGHGDPTRIAAGVASGIGFLGAGAILRQGVNIKGLTSAAIVWTAAAIGLSIGAGLYIPAFVVTLITVFTLVKLEPVERKFFPAGKIRTIRVTYESNEVDLKKIKEIVKSSGMIIAEIGIKQTKNETSVEISAKSPDDMDLATLSKNLNLNGKMESFEFLS